MLCIYSKGMSNHIGGFICKPEGCWHNGRARNSQLTKYKLDKDYGFYDDSRADCFSCTAKCAMDNNCGAVECEGVHGCVWWSNDKCTGKNSPEYFKYNAREKSLWGITCWKGAIFFA